MYPSKIKRENRRANIHNSIAALSLQSVHEKNNIASLEKIQSTLRILEHELHILKDLDVLELLENIEKAEEDE